MNKNKNKFEKFFNNNKKNIINKWDHYFEIYDRYFKKYKDQDIVLLEIGVSNGGSLKMWEDYFSNNSKIYGVDIDPRCKEFESKNIEIFIGSQTDLQFLKKIKNKIPKVDILIDDGGHFMNQQIISFNELFGHIKDDGVYLCEDTHTSYWLSFGGGYKRRGTFLEYSKNFIDQLNAFHSEQKELRPNQFTSSVDSIHYYDSVVVIQKKKRNPPKNLISGELSFGKSKISNFSPKLKPSQKNRLLIVLNKIIRRFRIGNFLLK
tara:strand:- start:1654 stop:2439 length:786 start_codon:yes stop_codon:yes gene_type:complete